MSLQGSIYHSGGNKSAIEAHFYSQTHKSPHRYLAYRDIPMLIDSYIQGKKSLDYGTGTGCSVQFLLDLGFDVTGVDISEEMLFQAMQKCPHVPFHQIQQQKIPLISNFFDLVFSSFVLFEMGTEAEILTYLIEAKRVMKIGGIFVAVTGSQHLHSYSRNWMSFNTKFEENKNLKSGGLAKLYLYDPGIEFIDYYWTEHDYRDFFMKSGLQLQVIYYPLAKQCDPYSWKDEKKYSPFVIFIAKKHF